MTVCSLNLIVLEKVKTLISPLLLYPGLRAQVAVKAPTRSSLTDYLEKIGSCSGNHWHVKIQNCISPELSGEQAFARAVIDGQKRC